MKKFNVSTKRIYTTKDGTEKIHWNGVGTLTQFDDGFALELGMFPETKFYVFSQEDKAKVGTKQVYESQESSHEEKSIQTDYPENTINPEDIPF